MLHILEHANLNNAEILLHTYKGDQIQNTDTSFWGWRCAARGIHSKLIGIQSGTPILVDNSAITFKT